jgi:DNA invertase Pin-like site-specific DNA recombinase
VHPGVERRVEVLVAHLKSKLPTPLDPEDREPLEPGDGDTLGSALSTIRRAAEAAAERRVQAVIAWHPDRLHRSLVELERFIERIERHRIDVHTVPAGDVDLSTPVGRMFARQLGTFARYESEHRGERAAAGAPRPRPPGPLGRRAPPLRLRPAARRRRATRPRRHPCRRPRRSESDP